MQNEEFLIQRFQEGSKDVLEQILEGYTPLLYTLARRLCCPAAMTEELVQSGYVGLILAARRFDVSRHLRFITYAVPWVLGEMRKNLHTLLSNYAALPMEGGDNCEQPSLADVLSGEGEPDADIIDLKIAMKKLERDEQMLISLRYFRDVTQKEASCLLGKSQSQISRMEQRALDKLRACLA